MSSLTYEVVLEKLGALISSGQVINKSTIGKIIEKEEISISQEEWRELLLLYGKFYQKVKGGNLSKEERMLVIRGILYPDEVVQEEEAKEDSPPPPTRLEKAIHSLKEKELTITNAHIVLKEVSEEFNLSSE